MKEFYIVEHASRGVYVRSTLVYDCWEGTKKKHHCSYSIPRTTGHKFCSLKAAQNIAKEIKGSYILHFKNKKMEIIKL